MRNSQVSVRYGQAAHYQFIPRALLLTPCGKVRVLDHLTFMNSKTLFKVRTVCWYCGAAKVFLSLSMSARLLRVKIASQSWCT